MVHEMLASMYCFGQEEDEEGQSSCLPSAFRSAVSVDFVRTSPPLPFNSDRLITSGFLLADLCSPECSFVATETARRRLRRVVAGQRYRGSAAAGSEGTDSPEAVREQTPTGKQYPIRMQSHAPTKRPLAPTARASVLHSTDPSLRLSSSPSSSAFPSKSAACLPPTCPAALRTTR